MGNRRNIYSKYRILKISSSYGIWRSTGIFFCVNKIKKKKVLLYNFTWNAHYCDSNYNVDTVFLMYELLYRYPKTKEKYYHGKRPQQWSLT